MFSWRELGVLLLVSLATAHALAQVQAQPAFSGIGRPATSAEVSAWDIDVRPDLKGLPKGSGSVAKGHDVWEAQCASCHGYFGESNVFFSPLVGGTSKADMQSGKVARLTDAGYPGRTTLMKLPTISTLWDYINRAMPWNAPKSLSTEEVYAVTAYMLNMAGVLPDDFTLSDANMAEVQKRLPNRNGMSAAHAMWPGKAMSQVAGKNGQMIGPDVNAVACMKDCAPPVKVASFLPDYARNQHGNLADQQRLVGPQRGVVTAASLLTNTAALKAKAGSDLEAVGLALAKKHSCTACHGADMKIVGPGFKEIGLKYANRSDAQTYLAERIKGGGQGVWGSIPMPAQALSAADAKTIASWLASGLTE